MSGSWSMGCGRCFGPLGFNRWLWRMGKRVRAQAHARCGARGGVSAEDEQSDRAGSIPFDLRAAQDKRCCSGSGLPASRSFTNGSPVRCNLRVCSGLWITLHARWPIRITKRSLILAMGFAWIRRGALHHPARHGTMIPELAIRTIPPTDRSW